MSGPIVRAVAAPEPELGPRPIRELPDLVAAQIAAGEVIERPAAVLKELLENALDAGARRIAIEIEGAGRERIAVHDDGRGIPAAELPLAFRRHATSKLERVDDLSRLASYGFRGEALPAIAAAAGRLRLTTRCVSEPSASLIEFERGLATGPRPAARAVGTSVEVFDLFRGQPARRAFLAGARAERTALVRAAADVILAHPECSLRITIDGRTPLNHAAAAGASGSAVPCEAALREALAAVFSPDAAARAIWLEDRSQRAELSLDGFAGAPDDARRTRERLRLFVNGRPVRDRRLSYALAEAYRDWLRAGQHPLVVARLSLPPDAVDVNIHPAKTEVKLRDPDAAFSLLQRSVREALARERAAVPLRVGPDRVADPVRPGAASPDEAPPPARSAEPSATASALRRAALPTRRPREWAVAEPTLSPALEAQPAGASLPPLRMVGQLHRTFIIAEGPGGLVLVDQHGAHERVLYERLLAASSGDGGDSSQPLLDPLTVSLDAEESAHWEAAAERLRGLGFDLAPFGERTLRVHALPAAVASADAEALLRGVLADLSGADWEPERFDRAAASTACHASVRRGQVLDPPAMAALLRDLERCDNPHSCPHGRPTLVEISADDVLREFRRK
ncbi:MAG: DNA mismatch repair endonuclease MutL [Chloroflexota bacterium]|nr:DNA mismatch repair endonuclease MutL [Chloroflexota bacterium]